MKRFQYALGICGCLAVVSALGFALMQMPQYAFAQDRPNQNPQLQAGTPASPGDAFYAPSGPAIGLAAPPSLPGTARPRYYATPNMPQQMSKEEMEEQRQLVELLKQIRSGGDEEKATEARTELKDLLSNQLDRDLAKREESLQEIERRAAELRTQLETRRKNKEQTLEILMMLAENPAAGLGIPPQWMQSFGIDNNSRFPAQYPPGRLTPTPNAPAAPPSPQANPFGEARRAPAALDPFGGPDSGGDPFGENPFGS